MNYKQLAKTIRTQQAEYKTVTHQLMDQLNTTKNQCKHNLVVIVCSGYTGSYSQDYDDGHDEFRQCLICGHSESAEKNKFQVLLNPMRRLELGYPYYKNSRYTESPLANCLTTPLQDLIQWVEQNGWQI